MARAVTDEQLINGYIESMQFRNLSDETIKVRRSYLTKLSREVGFQGDSEIEEPSHRLLDLRQKIQRWLMRDGLAPQTRALWITTIHGLYKWANKEGYFRRVEAPNGALVDFDPTDGLLKPKGKKGHPHPITEKDLALVVKMAPDEKVKAWMLLEAGCGLRCKEVALLERRNIHTEGVRPRLALEHTKGEKPRDTVLPQEVIDALNECDLPDVGRLWLDTPAQVSRQINDHLHRFNAMTTEGTRATAHSLRHRFATAFFRATEDAFLTADVLGHSSTEITRIYAAADTSKSDKALAALVVLPVPAPEPEEIAS